MRRNSKYTTFLQFLCQWNDVEIEEAYLTLHKEFLRVRIYQHSLLYVTTRFQIQTIDSYLIPKLRRVLFHSALNICLIQFLKQQRVLLEVRKKKRQKDNGVSA